MKTKATIAKNATVPAGRLPYLVNEAQTTAEAAVRLSVDEQFPVVAAFLADEQAREHAEHAEPSTPDLAQVAEEAIRTVLRARLAGHTTNPRDLADLLQTVIEDEQAEHLARPEVGGFPIDQARSHEAFSTAVQAVNRALRLTANRAQTVTGLRAMLEMAIDEVDDRLETVASEYQDCPRCRNKMDLPGASRATPDREIEICGPCCSDEAMREAAGLPWPSVSEWPVPRRTGA